MGIGTFEEYCEKRWGFSDRYARDLMSAERVIQAIENRNRGSDLKTGTVVPIYPRLSAKRGNWPRCCAAMSKKLWNFGTNSKSKRRQKSR